MFARTERLLLRPVWNEDAAALTKAICDEAIVRNLANAPWPYTMADARAFIAIDHHERTPNFMIIRRTNGLSELIGSCGLAYYEDGIEIGYWIARQHWGLGYASEAARAVLEIAHSLGHKQICAGYFADNPASGHVLRKLGFLKTGALTSRYSKGRAGPAAMIAMRIRDLAKTLKLNEPEGGCNIALCPPAYYDSHYNDEKLGDEKLGDEKSCETILKTAA